MLTVFTFLISLFKMRKVYVVFAVPILPLTHTSCPVHNFAIYGFCHFCINVKYIENGCHT